MTENVLVGLIILYSAVGRACFRSGRSFSAVVSSLRYSRETHPTGSDTHGCFTLHFANNGNENLTKSLKQTLPTAVFRIIAWGTFPHHVGAKLHNN